MLATNRQDVSRDGSTTRRDFLRIGSLGADGLTLPTLLQARESQGANRSRAARGTFGRAKSCILLFMDGGPPQMDTFDFKPEALAEICGESKGKLDRTALQGFFCDHKSTICRHAGSKGSGLTVNSMLFDCARLEAHVSCGPGRAGRWITFLFE